MTATVLGPAERDRQWVSNLTLAHYRWDEATGWQSRSARQDIWYPVHPTPEPLEQPEVAFADVFAYPNERFEEST